MSSYDTQVAEAKREMEELEGVEEELAAADRRMLDLGTAAEVLFAQGEEQAVALLLDVEALDYEEQDDGWISQVAAYLTVPARLVALFTDEICERITDALRLVNERTGTYVSRTQAVPTKAGTDWKDGLQAALQSGPTNQARRAPVKNPIVEDGIVYRSTAELALGRALKRANEGLPEHEKLSLIVNTTVLVNGHPREVDFVVLWNGRAAAIEVDGPYHRGRAAADQSKDRLFVAAGVMFVDRVCVEDTNDAENLDRVVNSFLARVQKN